MIFYQCVSNTQLISGKRKKKTQACCFQHLGRRQGVAGMSCHIYIWEHSVQLYAWNSFMSYNANLWVGCNSCSETLTLQICFAVKISHLWCLRIFLALNPLHSLWWHESVMKHLGYLLCHDILTKQFYCFTAGTTRGTDITSHSEQLSQ